MDIDATQYNLISRELLYGDNCLYESHINKSGINWSANNKPF